MSVLKLLKKMMKVLTSWRRIIIRNRRSRNLRMRNWRIKNRSSRRKLR